MPEQLDVYMSAAIDKNTVAHFSEGLWQHTRGSQAWTGMCEQQEVIKALKRFQLLFGTSAASASTGGAVNTGPYADVRAAEHDQCVRTSTGRTAVL